MKDFLVFCDRKPGNKSFQTATIIYDATYWFCEKYLHPRSRTVDQMLRAALPGAKTSPRGMTCLFTLKNVLS
jgi:hypothetical protein